MVLTMLPVISSSLSIIVLLPLSVLAINCKINPNGKYNTGCDFYILCKDGVMTQVYCPESTAYNYRTQECEDETTVPPPCRPITKCRFKGDGRYLDEELSDETDVCRGFYECREGRYRGSFMCPATLVFNEDIEGCDWKANTRRPCGTYEE